jgi:hypothetical protein
VTEYVGTVRSCWSPAAAAASCAAVAWSSTAGACVTAPASGTWNPFGTTACAVKDGGVGAVPWMRVAPGVVSACSIAASWPPCPEKPDALEPTVTVAPAGPPPPGATVRGVPRTYCPTRWRRM